MENWKKAVLAGSAGLAAILLLKGNRTGGLLFSWRSPGGPGV